MLNSHHHGPFSSSTVHQLGRGLKTLGALARFLPPERLAQEEAPATVSSRRGWMVNQIFQHWGHRWIYDFEELAYVLEEARFERDEIQECSFRHGQASRLYEMAQAMRSDESTYVEARKPR